MDIGKLPPQILARLLAKVQVRDPRVIVGPRVGEDAALIEFGDRLLVAKSDPVTFAIDRIGWYVVQVNANDIAVMGATPRWFLCTLLLPESADEAQAEAIFDQVLEACRGLDVALVGGHTEITYGLDRPIAVGAMLGEVAKGRQVLSSGVREGDVILLTKGIALEGTALLAREAGPALEAAGVAAETIRRAASLLFRPGISVVPEAAALCAAGGVHGLHDPTEGGLATGLQEMAQASGVGIELDAGSVPVLPETGAVCRALGLDPLGLLASGALLAAVDAGQSDRHVEMLRERGIAATVVGRAVPASLGLVMTREGTRRALPSFPRDELARFLAQG